MKDTNPNGGPRTLAGRPLRRPGRLLRCACLLLLATTLPARDPDPGDLSRATLEELMNIDITSVSRKQQKLSHAAAAVYVVTREDIRRSGANCIPEALRMVPGVQVAQIDSARWVVGVRGFDDRFSNKLLVLIDGRSIYNNAFAGVNWDQIDVMLEDIERIEVIRGPGATMWGANAVNGVVNIISRKAADTQGVLISLTSGNLDLATTALRYGGARGERLRYRLFGKQVARNHMLTDSLLDARDSWNSVRGGARLDFDWSESDSLSFQADLYRAGSGQRYYPEFLVLPSNEIREYRARLSGGYLMGHWLHRHQSGAESAFQVYYNEENRAEAMAALYMRRLDFDFEQRLRSWRGHELMWGLGYRSYWDNTGSDRPATFHPASRQVGLYSTFLQDEWSLLPDRLLLTAGAKAQRNVYTGVDFQPSGRLLWIPGPQHSLWAAASQAARTPSRRDADAALSYQLPGGPAPITVAFRGNPQPLSETVRAYEIGYRAQPSEHLMIDVTAFRNHYRNLLRADPGQPFFVPLPEPHLVAPVSFRYTGTARAEGVELSSTWAIHPKWKMTANYAWLRMDVGHDEKDGGATPSATLADIYPSHQSFLRSSVNLSRSWTVDATLYYLSAMHGDVVQANTRLDLRFGFRPAENSEWSFGLANLLDPQHPEFAPDSFDARSQVPRSLYLRYVWGR